MTGVQAMHGVQLDTTGTEDRLRDALGLWWLRPENGLALASYCLRGVALAPAAGERAADFACGDGVNTFFKCGGRFDFSFDIFGKAVHPASAKEIAEKSIDVFDYEDRSYAPGIKHAPGCRYTYGTDHKKSLLHKAEKLDFYDRLLHVDLRQEAEIPDESLDLAYCNSLYWVAEASQALELMVRKVRPGGRIVIDVMTAQRKTLRYENLLPTMPADWASLMNRGRQHNNPGIQDEAGWDRMFGIAGMTEIVDKRDIFPTAIAMVWNVGLRPVFPVLNRMAQAIAEEKRLEIKREWVDTMVELLLPVLMMPEHLVPSGPAVRLQYVMQRI